MISVMNVTVCRNVTCPCDIKGKGSHFDPSASQPLQSPWPRWAQGKGPEKMCHPIGTHLHPAIPAVPQHQFCPPGLEMAIIPVPKTAHIKSLNDFKPIALTPLLSKCMGRLMSKELTSHIYTHGLHAVCLSNQPRCGGRHSHSPGQYMFI